MRSEAHTQGVERALFLQPTANPVPEWLHLAAQRLAEQYWGVHTTEEFASVVKTLTTLKAKPFEVFIVGEGNFGKSTLLNALLGVKVSSIHFLPETRAFLRYVTTTSPSNQAKLWVRAQGSAHDWLLERLGRGRPSDELFRAVEYQLPVDSAEAVLREEAARARKEKGYQPAIIEFERELAVGPGCPFPSQVRVVDTQGLNQIFPDEMTSAAQHEASTSVDRFARWMSTNPRGQHLDWQLRRCDAVLWLAHARKPGAAVTQAALEHFARYGKKTVLVVTHIDEVQGGPEAAAEVTERLRRAHQDHIEAMCLIDAKKALEASLAGDARAAESSGLKKLSEVITEVAVGKANLVRMTGAYNSLRRTEGQLREALVRMSDDIRQAEGLLSTHRQSTRQAAERAAAALAAGLDQSEDRCLDKLVARLATIGLGGDSLSVEQQLSAHALADAHRSAAIRLLDEQMEGAERLLKQIQKQPYALPTFDAEGRRAGISVQASAAVQLDSILLPPLHFRLKLPSTLFDQGLIGVAKVLGWFWGAAREKAAEWEHEAIAERHQAIAAAFDQAWTPFNQGISTAASKATVDLFAGISAGIDQAEHALELQESAPLAVTRKSLTARLERIAVPSAVLSALNGLLRRIYRSDDQNRPLASDRQLGGHAASAWPNEAIMAVCQASPLTSNSVASTSTDTPKRSPFW